VTVRDKLRVAADIARVLGGVGAHVVTGRTPDIAYQSMIRLFCRSGGLSNDALTRVIRLMSRPRPFAETRGVLGDMKDGTLDHAVHELEQRGYRVFDSALPVELCDRLVAFALDAQSTVRTPAGSEHKAGRESRQFRRDRDRPIGVRYDLSPADVVNQRDVQDLMADPSLLALAQAYLGSNPIADVTSMWWHTGFSRQPDEEAAQFFHFDMDRIRWLKIFIYLTDVGPGSGAHCFVEGSHRTHAIPPALLSKGYSRLTDGEVLRHFNRTRIVEMHAPRGTVIVEDTRGLHKGREVLSGDRLMLQLQFSSSLFGGRYPPVSFSALHSPSLARMAAARPGIYANYLDRRTR
jgi:Phytanoyl-CoA dioxygenase (PhyH)